MAAIPPIMTARRDRLAPDAAELRKGWSGAGGIALRLLFRPAFYHRARPGSAGYFRRADAFIDAVNSAIRQRSRVTLPPHFETTEPHKGRAVQFGTPRPHAWPVGNKGRIFQWIIGSLLPSAALA
jgi:hypothetical protein